MGKLWHAVLALGLASAIAAPAAAQQAGRADFHAGGIDFTMPLPKGFCIANSAKGQAVAQLITAADADNLTLLVLFDCEGIPGEATDYFVIKMPRQAMFMEVTREQVIREISAAFDTPEFKQATAPDRIDSETAKSIGGVLNTEVEIESAFAPFGHDDVCVYMQGTVTMGIAGKQIKAAVAGCMTAMGGRMITIYRYGDGMVPGKAKTLVPVVRAVAESIAVKPGS